MIYLKNQNLTVKIAELGAELQSIIVNGKQYFWEGNKDIWDKHSPLLFPICGGLKDDKFSYQGKEYTLQKHGYGMTTLFEVEAVSDTSVTLLHRSNEDTLKCYPFTYELRVVFTLVEGGVKVTYKVNNLGENEMYFAIGSHETYYTPEGIEDYDLIFAEKETLDSCKMFGNMITDITTPILNNSNVLPLYEKYFFAGALVFRNINSRSATLRNRKTGRFVHIDFPNKPNFIMWHMPNAPFICLEPWVGIQDPPDTCGDITKKEGMVCLNVRASWELSHTLTFGENS